MKIASIYRLQAERRNMDAGKCPRCPNTNKAGVCMYAGPCLSCQSARAQQAAPQPTDAAGARDGRDRRRVPGQQVRAGARGDRRVDGLRVTRDLVAEHFARKAANPFATRDHAPPPDRTPMLITDTDYQVPDGHALVLRVCRADLSSSHGFRWPAEGEVRALDWSPEAVCGYGLHGWLWGVGDISVAGGVHGTEGARWLVVEVDLSQVVNLTNKVKFPRGIVRFVGDAKDAAAIVARHAPAGSAIIYGTATAGCDGTATAGDNGTATAGDRGTATAGCDGTATAGERGSIAIRSWDSVRERYRFVVGEVGENGIEANVPYVLDAAGKLVRQ